MFRLAAAAVLLLALCGAGPVPAPKSTAAMPAQAFAASPVARLRALAAPTKIAQVQCPAPDANESFCGVYNNECIYCPSGLSHACLAQNKCFEVITDAQAVCGNDFVVCGRPAG